MPPLRSLEADVGGQGPAVVLLHGQPGRGDNWQLASDLLADRFTTIAPDRLGYGRTGGPSGDFQANAAATVGLLDRLGVERAIVAGHSWGGPVAMEMAANWPGRVAGLVLVASVAPGEPISAVDRLLAHRPLGDLAAMVSIGLAGSALSVPLVRRVAERRLPAGVVHYMTQSPEPAGSGWRSFVAEQRVFVEQIGTLGGLLDAIMAPTRVVVGTADRIVRPEASVLLAERIPGAVLQRVEGAGHLLPWEHPDAVAVAVTAVAHAADPGGA